MEKSFSYPPLFHFTLLPTFTYIVRKLIDMKQHLPKTVEARRLFHSICVYVDKKLEVTPDTFTVEPDLLFLLQYITSNPGLREHFVQLFIELVQGTLTPAPRELMEFCLRELQYPEVKLALEEEISKDDPDTKSTLQSILSVYDTEWPDSYMYNYYSS